MSKLKPKDFKIKSPKVSQYLYTKEGDIIKPIGDLEYLVAKTLIDNNIRFTHDSQLGSIKKLDFHLVDYNCFIEVKHSIGDRKSTATRLLNQLKLQKAVILLQGKDAVEVFCKLINNKTV